MSFGSVYTNKNSSHSLGRHTTVIFQGPSHYRLKYGVSKALTSLQTMTESFGLLLLQAHVIIQTWSSNYRMPIGGLADIGILLVDMF